MYFVKPDWLAICEQAADRIEGPLADLDACQRAEEVGDGVGGDRTLVLDRLAEDIVFEELEKVAAGGHPLRVISEERGEVELGSNPGWTVVVDPIDGSLNAKRGLTACSLSIAVADGSSMEDVCFGYVRDFGSSETFHAVSGSGAYLNGNRISAGVSERLEIVAIEGAAPARVAEVVGCFQDRVYRLRCIGSIAISVSNLAAGRIDAMASLFPCRSVDAAAAQLIAIEAGAKVAFASPTGERVRADLSLNSRYHCIAARCNDHLTFMIDAISGRS